MYYINWMGIGVLITSMCNVSSTHSPCPETRAIARARAGTHAKCFR